MQRGQSPADGHSLEERDGGERAEVSRAAGEDRKGYGWSRMDAVWD